MSDKKLCQFSWSVISDRKPKIEILGLWYITWRKNNNSKNFKFDKKIANSWKFWLVQCKLRSIVYLLHPVSWNRFLSIYVHSYNAGNASSKVLLLFLFFCLSSLWSVIRFFVNWKVCQINFEVHFCNIHKHESKQR